MTTQEQFDAINKEIANSDYVKTQQLLKQLAQQITQNKFKGDDK